VDGYRLGAPARVLFLALVAALALTGISAGTGAAKAHAKCEKANASVGKLRKKEIRGALRCVVNKERGRNLSPKDQLHEAAQNHTGYMRKSRCLSHQCPGEPQLYERVRRTGYFNGASSYAYGEVIAKNRSSASPRDIVRQWMGSSGHRAALMSGGYEHLGVGASVRSGTGIFTIVLGARSG
jgi:uncharacterized protein YkwD